MKMFGIKDRRVQIHIDDSLVTDNVKKLYTQLKAKRKDNYCVVKDDGSWANPTGFTQIDTPRNPSNVVIINYGADLTSLPSGFCGCIQLNASDVGFDRDIQKAYGDTYFAQKFDRYTTDGTLMISMVHLQTLAGNIYIGRLRYGPSRKWVYSVIDTFIVGQFALLPNRPDHLPKGWYFRNGDYYLVNSPVGDRLNRMTTDYKKDNKMFTKEIDGKSYINVPNAFHSDGRGYFERPIDGVNRQVGSIQGDYIRNIRGAFPNIDDLLLLGIDSVPPSGQNNGAIGLWKGPHGITEISSGMSNGGAHVAALNAHFDFDASRNVPTGNENTVINYGLTPAIYIGV